MKKSASAKQVPRRVDYSTCASTVHVPILKPRNGSTFVIPFDDCAFLPEGCTNEKLHLVLYATQGCGVESLVEGAAVLLVHCPPLVRAGICNLFAMSAIAHSFITDTVGSKHAPTDAGRRVAQFNVLLKDGTHIDESSYL